MVPRSSARARWPRSTHSVNGAHFTEMWKELSDGFSTVGFTDEELDDLFHLLSGVVHMAELDFTGDDAAQLCSEPAILTTICDQLSIEETAIELALTRKVCLALVVEVVGRWRRPRYSWLRPDSGFLEIISSSPQTGRVCAMASLADGYIAATSIGCSLARALALRCCARPGPGGQRGGD